MNLVGWGRSPRVTPWLALVGAACASSPTVAPTTSIRLDPAPAAATAQAPLPNLPPMTGGASIADSHGPRLRELGASDQDLTTVVRVLADRFGMQYSVDPSVKARVNTSLRNKTL